MKLHKNSNLVRQALVEQFNALRELSVGSAFHYQVTPSAPPSGEPLTATALAITANTLSSDAARAIRANDIKRVLNEHYKDMAAHKTVQTTAIAVVDATDLATANTLINACKASFYTSAHINTANVHPNNDPATCTAADASSQGTFDTLAAEITTEVNAHIANGMAGQHIVLEDS